MQLPFTTDQFLDVFGRYNLTVWPAQWILMALGILATWRAVRDRPNSGRWVSAILALLWLWMAIAYHVAFFASVTRAAFVFALGFAAQAALFGWTAFRRLPISYRPRSRVAAIIGAALMLYGWVVYPVIGRSLGHDYPSAPTFGVPCPTTIFTLALVVWADASLPRRLLIVPLAWSVVATSAAVTLGMTEDLGLTVAGIMVALRTFIARRPAQDRALVRA